MTAPEFPPGYVVQVQNLGYAVRSRTVDGAFWMVTGKDCTCPAGQHGSTVCFHRLQVARFVKAINESKKRPTAPPAISQLCD